MSLLFLSSDDFVLSKGTKGPILCTQIPGFSLVLFYSTQCPHCTSLIPIFKKLPGSMGGCVFAMCNVSVNKQCVRMSKDTIAPISYVPLILLHVNGRPYMRYAGPYDLDEIRRFILDVAKKIENKQKFSSEVVKEDVRGKIPAYSVGVPKCDDDNICYLHLCEAYPNK